MGKKFKNVVVFDAPLRSEFEVVVRYDKQFKTNFVSLFSTEIRPNQATGVCEETTVCLNSKKEAKEFLKVIKKALEKVK